MKKIIVMLAMLTPFFISAQITKVDLQASGLTCSMCSNAINKSLQSLPFVEKVMSNISTSSFDITLKPGAAFTFDNLKDKVEDAGFFVANMTATINFDNVEVKKDDHINYAGMTFHFLNTKNQNLNGEKKIKVLDKGYVSSKEYKKNQGATSMDCYRTGVAAACCTKDGVAEGQRIYHVSI